jgi:signal peptidase I
MQCPGCRFENIPGLASCGRCGTSLALATATIDINPPRASRTQKKVRRVVPRRAFYVARDLSSQARRSFISSSIDRYRVPLPEPAVLSRLIVPGWAQIHSGLGLRGRIFLGSFLALLVLGMLQWGTELGSMLLGLAFSVHASSIVDILIRQGTVRFPRMMATAALVGLALAMLVYYPAGQLLMRVAAPIEYSVDSPPFKRFDVVLVNRWAHALGGPGRGDVVLFRPTRPMRIGATATIVPFIRHAFDENELVDRVLGLPGDRVVCDEGKISVNGVAVSWVPLIPERMPRHLEIAVPLGQYLILPTTSAAGIDTPDPRSVGMYIGLVPTANVLGGVYLRLSPIWRLWFIR